jgi:beta-lactamase regulating signal transducer with metallopeptidase domain
MTAAFHLLETGLNEIAQTSTLRIVDCLIEGTLITIFAGLVLRAARLRNSGTRFAVWFAALVAIAAVPFLGGAWAHGVIPSQTLNRPAITVPGSWAVYLFAAWAVIAGWALVRVGQGLRHLHVLRESCVPVNVEGLDLRIQQTLARSQAGRNVAFCASGLVHVPTAIGLLKPAVIVPKWVLEELSANELNQILLHELAHLRRWDDWTNLAQKIVKALFFFHPAVWWIEKKVSLEREMACDDAVLAETESPRAYAECLAHLAEKTLIQRSVALAQAALGRLRHTSLRVAKILDVNRAGGAAGASKPAVLLVAGFAVACLVSVSSAPSLIAFEDGGARAAAAAPAVASNSLDNATENVSPAMPMAKVTNAKFTAQSVPWVQAKLTVQEPRRPVQKTKRAVAKHKPTPTLKASADVPVPEMNVSEGDVLQADIRQSELRQTDLREGSVHYTDARLTDANVIPVAFTETFFVVVEGRESGISNQPVYQIQMWRLTVLHPAVDSNTRVHPKQI